MLKREELIEVVSPLNLWGRKQNLGVTRGFYLADMEKYLSTPDIVVAIIGPRRVGKTFLTKQFLNLKSKETNAENTLYVLFEEPKFEPYLKTGLLEEIYQAYRTYVNRNGLVYLVLDEVQNLPGWEKWVRMALERGEKIKIIVTGSSAKLFSRELATILTGRTLTLKVFPLNFKEFLSFKGLAFEKEYELLGKKEEVRKLLTEYLTYGGFPQVVLQADTAVKEDLLKELFEGIIYRDVVFRHKIRDGNQVRTTAEIALSHFASLLSANRLRNSLVSILLKKISPNLVVKILAYLEEAFLIFQIPVFSYKIKERKLLPRKVYAIDPGLIKIVTINFSRNIGRVYENIVAVSLLRKKGIENLFYWKDASGQEVDFVIKEGIKVKQLIQVSYETEDKKTREREFRSLFEASNELNCANLLLITDNFEGEETRGRKKIICLPLWKWLLT